MRTLKRWYWSEIVNLPSLFTSCNMGLDMTEIHRRYPQYPKTTLYQHMKHLYREDILLSWWGLLWRKRKNAEGLHQECWTKDKKEGTGGCMTNFLVAISHERGVIECFWYEGIINGELFLQCVRDRFPHIFSKANNQKGKLFLQDGDPSQDFKMSQEAMDKIPYRLLMISPLPWSKPHWEHISSCWRVSKERCHHEEGQNRDLWTVL